MENQTIDILEQKILQLLAAHAKAKSEITQLQAKIKEMQANAEEKERALATLREDAEQGRKVLSEVETFREKQDRIRFKLQNLIEKLQEFEDAA